MSRLAMHGGAPVRTAPFPLSKTTGEEEVQAGIEVLRSGLLSGFVGSPGSEFYGGPKVRGLEYAWGDRFDVRHAVSCNSATSALIIAVGASAIGPGDEVIVSPYTMSATAIAILVWGGIPVFADIEPDYFCLDPISVAKNITPRTRAILTTDIHGQSSDVDAIMKLARDHGLTVIVDCAQAAGAKYRDRWAGTLGDIGVYSLNRHKNIQCGEGGVAVTNDAELALRMQLIRNHGENLVEHDGFRPRSLVNILGYNFRMTEVDAAVALEQLKKLDRLNAHRVELAEFLTEKLGGLPGLQVPAVRQDCSHVYYMHVMLFDRAEVGISRKTFVDAIRAEGIPIWGGYLKPLYLAPLFQQRIAMGDKGFPFVGPHYSGNVSYEKGICPVAEHYYEERSIINPYLYPPLGRRDMEDIVMAIVKVIDACAELQARP